MTTQASSGRGLYFIVGALVVVVAGLAFFAFGGQFGGNDTKRIELKVDVPKAPAPANK